MGITRIHGGIENQSKGFLEYEKAFALSKNGCACHGRILSEQRPCSEDFRQEDPPANARSANRAVPQCLRAFRRQGAFPRGNFSAFC